MPLLTNFQESVLKSLGQYKFSILKMKGRCHEALIGEFINWWLKDNFTSNMICNPARASKGGYRRYVADILF